MVETNQQQQQHLFKVTTAQGGVIVSNRKVDVPATQGISSSKEIISEEGRTRTKDIREAWLSRERSALEGSSQQPQQQPQSAVSAQQPPKLAITEPQQTQAEAGDLLTQPPTASLPIEATREALVTPAVTTTADDLEKGLGAQPILPAAEDKTGDDRGYISSFVSSTLVGIEQQNVPSVDADKKAQLDERREISSFVAGTLDGVERRNETLTEAPAMQPAVEKDETIKEGFQNLQLAPLNQPTMAEVAQPPIAASISPVEIMDPNAVPPQVLPQGMPIPSQVTEAQYTSQPSLGQPTTQAMQDEFVPVSLADQQALPKTPAPTPISQLNTLQDTAATTAAPVASSQIPPYRSSFLQQPSMPQQPGYMSHPIGGALEQGTMKHSNFKQDLKEAWKQQTGMSKVKAVGSVLLQKAHLRRPATGGVQPGMSYSSQP